MVTDMQYEQVKELIELFEKTDLNDMEVRLGDASIRLNRGLAQQPPFPPMHPGVMPSTTQNTDAVMDMNQTETKENMASDTASSATVPQTESAAATKSIKAPIVGTFYQSSAPDQPPYLKVGDTVAAGDVVCIIEAMKFMNEVTSDVSGTVTDILVEDGQFVEFGQELFRIQ